MATLKAKDVYTGKLYEIGDVELNMSIQDFVDSLVSAGMIPSAPLAPDGTSQVWSLVDKNNVKIQENDRQMSIAEAGFSDGDTITLIHVGGGATL